MQKTPFISYKLVQIRDFPLIIKNSWGILVPGLLDASPLLSPSSTYIIQIFYLNAAFYFKKCKWLLQERKSCYSILYYIWCRVGRKKPDSKKTHMKNFLIFILVGPENNDFKYSYLLEVLMDQK